MTSFMNDPLYNFSVHGADNGSSAVGSKRDPLAGTLLSLSADGCQRTISDGESYFYYNLI